MPSNTNDTPIDPGAPLLRLKRVANPWMDSETVRFRNLGEFFELSQASERDFEYTVSWIDCAFSGKRLGRGARLS